MASLTQRTGALGKRLAAHLLRRTTFHITKSQIDAFALKTADQAVNDLLSFPALAIPAGPRSYLNGADWVTEVPHTDNHGGLTTSKQRNATYSWWLHELFQDTSMRGRLAVFLDVIWVNGRIENGTTGFHYLRLTQEFAKGNLKTFAKKMTLDIDMLYYLDNRSNKDSSPNENYSREFLELFTILKGPQIGADNYTNYTEADISEAARVLTGFTASKNTTFYNNFDPDTGLARGAVDFSKHDTTNKTFSSAFGNTVITGAVDEADAYRELSDFVDMVFAQVETARAYCRRLYRYFVSDIIDAEIEADIIEPLATELHANDYEFEPTIKRLLKSTHFYDEDDSSNTDEIIGSKVKSPMMLNLQTMSYLEMGNVMPDTVTNTENFYDKLWSNSIAHNMFQMGQPGFPLTVEGYPGYFKDPDYSRNWFNSATVAARYLFMSYLLIGKKVGSGSMLLNGDKSFQPDIPTLVANIFTNQDDADALVIQVLETLLSEMPEGYDSPSDTSKRYNYFREALLGGLSTINWMFEWQNAQANVPDAVASVKVALDRFFDVVISSPEYQTF